MSCTGTRGKADHDPLSLLWIFFILASLQPVVQRQLLAAQRHDHPLLARDLEALGLPIKIGVGAEERALLELYPQPRGRQSPFEYFPGTPGAPPGLPPGRERPRRAGTPQRSA